jgi:hypothetical protein
MNNKMLEPVGIYVDTRAGECASFRRPAAIGSLGFDRLPSAYTLKARVIDR